MSAAGKVITGFSKPYVALYSNVGANVSYTSGQELARGVEVDIQATSSNDNTFYANNSSAESTAGKFSGGTLKLVVDGLHDTARKLILGLPEASDQGLTGYGDDMVVPYVGVGAILRYQSGGEVTYVPLILPKVRFSDPGTKAKTQEADIDWQTEELSAAISRDDTAKHNWKYLGADLPTEEAAEAAIKTFLGIGA